MHAADGALSDVVGDISLGDERLQPVRFEFLLAERASKKAARILLAIEIDDKGAFQLGFRENHNQLRRILEVTSDKREGIGHAFGRSRAA